MINLILHGTRSALSLLAVVIIWSLIIGLLAAFVGYHDREGS